MVGLDSGLLQTTNLCCFPFPGKPVALFCTILHRHIIPRNAPSLRRREIKYLFPGKTFFLVDNVEENISEKSISLLIPDIHMI